MKINVGEQLQVEGPKGTLTVPIPAGIRIEQNNGTLTIVRESDSVRRAARPDARAGRQRRHGVSTGFKRELDIVGIGYRVDVKGRDRDLHARLLAQIEFLLPDGVDMKSTSRRTSC